jgi:hypothetical protein
MQLAVAGSGPEHVHTGGETSLRTSYCPKRAVLIAACLTLAALALVLVGCGNSGSDAGLSATPPTHTPHVAASGPAVTGPVPFSALTLESKPRTTKDKNGLMFFKFRYADNDGKVYDCVLPKAMSQGQYTLGEWMSTFNAYRLPKVVAQKKVVAGENLGDYPFISPKPAPQTTPDQPGRAQPGEVPPMPPGIGVAPPQPPGGAAPMPPPPPGGTPDNPP